MGGIGKVRLVITKEKLDSKKFNFFFTNLLNASSEEILIHYSVRWEIETFYKEAKQNLGLGKSYLRRQQGALIHWRLVFAAYVLAARLLNILKDGYLRGKATIGKVCPWLKKHSDEIKRAFVHSKSAKRYLLIKD